MVLSPPVQAILILNIISVLFGLVAFYLSVKIFWSWDINSTSKTQYKNEKNSFLAATIIKYIFILKLPLFLFFIFTLDDISNVLIGAMCAAGVVDATKYGLYLFLLKILNIYLFGFWLILHNLDSKRETLPFTKLKFGFFIFAFIFFIFEVILEFVMFAAIDIDKMVSCCGTLYSSSSASSISAIFQIQTPLLLSSFYICFGFIVLFFFLKRAYLFALANALFLFLAIVSLISFFGTYIYELPTHHCPFCFLQKDYYYIGYILYTVLFLGTFSGLLTAIVKSLTQDKKQHNFFYSMSLFFLLCYVAIVSSYVIIYYVKNGVFL